MNSYWNSGAEQKQGMHFKRSRIAPKGDKWCGACTDIGSTLLKDLPPTTPLFMLITLYLCLLPPYYPLFME